RRIRPGAVACVALAQLETFRGRGPLAQPNPLIRPAYGFLIGLAVGSLALSSHVPFTFSALAAQDERRSNESARSGSDPSSAMVQHGYKLFDHNCAPCHGDDARGDEGPDLHGLRKSDARITKIIKEGIKGEMPAFGKKLSDSDVEALIGYLRSL